tara:strand:+ start:706 stop:1296 length:591 start_codon:yes stop_codon:yes gene_type:complete
MEYKEYLEQQTLLETPNGVSNLLLSLSEPELFAETRKRNVIEHRALLCYILRNNLKMTFESIADFFVDNGKSYDHSTAIHSCKMYPTYRKYNKNLYELEKLFVVYDEVEYEEISSMQLIMKRNKELEELLRDLKENISLYDLTNNEKEYRQLGKKQRETYDERASLVIKSFKWKARNEEVELISCNGGGLDARGIL